MEDRKELRVKAVEVQEEAEFPLEEVHHEVEEDHQEEADLEEVDPLEAENHQEVLHVKILELKGESP